MPVVGVVIFVSRMFWQYKFYNPAARFGEGIEEDGRERDREANQIGGIEGFDSSNA